MGRSEVNEAPRATSASPPTLGSVAARADVSRQTVSNALHHPERLAPSTRAHVLAVVAEMGYRPSLPARQLATRRSSTIAVRADRASDGISGLVLDAFFHGLAEAGHAAGLRVLLYPQLEDSDAEAALVGDLLAGAAADAVVLTGIESGDVRPRRLREAGQAFCAFGRPWSAEQHPYDWVDVDGAAGTQLAVKHLLSRGRRRIAYLGVDDHGSTGRERRTGWERGLLDAGLDPAGLAQDLLNDAGAAAQATAALLEQDDPPDAVVCGSDTLAFGAHVALTSRAADVLVTGFDATPVAAALGFASVGQPVRGAAEACLALVRERMAGGNAPARGLLLPPHLVVP